MSNIDAKKQEALEKWLQERSLQKSRARRRKYVPEEGGVTINSLMDVVTIILIFLLMNFSTDSLKISPNEKLDLPKSVTQAGPKERTVTLTVTSEKILVDDEEVIGVKISKNKLETSDPNSMKITPLKNALDKKVKEQKELLAKIKKGGAKDMITIIIHGGTQFHIVSRVMFTAGQAGFEKFKFAVIKGGSLSSRI